MEEQTDEVCDKCGKPMVIKWGRYGKFLACSGYPECKNTRQMAGSEGDRRPGAPRGRGQEVCPNDGQPMVLKKGRFGPFLACSNYPDCKVTKRLVRGAERQAAGGAADAHRRGVPRLRQGRSCGAAAASAPSSPAATIPTASTSRRRKRSEIGLPCPECGQGQVVERKGRWGRSFYGCKRYPECKFTAYHQPDPEPCPDCGRAVPAGEGDQEGRQGHLLRERGVPLQEGSRVVSRLITLALLPKY